MNKIYLLKQAVTDLTHEEFMAYVALKGYVDLNLNTTNMKESFITCVTIDTMIFTLFGTLTPKEATRPFKDNLKKGLDSLIEKGVIESKENNKNSYILELRNLYIDAENGDYYYITSLKEIFNILTIETKDKFSFFHYAQELLSTIWNGSEYQYGCSSVEDMALDVDISKQTALRYNNLLEEKQIIYIERNKYVNRYEDGTVHYQVSITV